MVKLLRVECGSAHSYPARKYSISPKIINVCDLSNSPPQASYLESGLVGFPHASSRTPADSHGSKNAGFCRRILL